MQVNFFGESTNLHEVWDSGMIYHYLQPSNGDWYNLYQHLSQDLSNNPDREQKYANVTNPVAWANESIAYVVNDVYNYDPLIPAGFSDPDLGTSYYNHNWPIAMQRMEAGDKTFFGFLLISNHPFVLT